MTKNYLQYIFLFFFSGISLSQVETINFNGYNGAGSSLSVTASSATVNDLITITFEDTDIINNFYTQFQNSVFMYCGLDTPAGSFQFVPGTFADLTWQPEFSLSSTDTDNNAAPNSYAIDINPSIFFTDAPDGTLVYGINLLFQNQFGGGGNNQSLDLYIDLVDATINRGVLSTDNFESTDVRATYNDGELRVTGLVGQASIEVFNILGKRVFQINNVTIENDFSKEISLRPKSMYVLRIRSGRLSKTLKLIAL
ncbi:T9SS type A sorting domain-containing protein [Sungkyunkwania multivorans]|uniref:T9SS type A sorting domain-containing protein n=1 Tax=Sungkyunkwania multivorans TaxID=1173618 RepID=A0ABW3CVL3_9FLAO